MSEIPGQSGRALPSLKPVVCARSRRVQTNAVDATVIPAAQPCEERLSDLYGHSKACTAPLRRVAKACELVHSHLCHPVHNVGAEGTRYDPTCETHTHMADD
jgi:hypothetical protein